MENFEHRVINGLLKASIGNSPEEAQHLLAINCEIVAPVNRSTESDLWPAIWALASVLERQFSGTVYINCGLSDELVGPVALGDRCSFEQASKGSVRIGLGCEPKDALCFGDARGATYSVGDLIDSHEEASSLACFAIAGYLGFAVLAKVVKIPPYREHLTLRSCALRFNPAARPLFPETGFTLAGLGHLGNAYLALLFFLSRSYEFHPRLHLIDQDIFQTPNYSTQILLREDGPWIDAPKTEYIAGLLGSCGWELSHEKRRLEWNWTRGQNDPRLLIMGLHDFDGRRVGVEAGFDWVFDSGLNSSFTQPRISWNALPPSREVGKALFTDVAQETRVESGTAALRQRLAAEPVACGWLQAFDDVTASAPCMGLVAASYVWAEIMAYLGGTRTYCTGSLALWSQILPQLETRTVL